MKINNHLCPVQSFYIFSISFFGASFEGMRIGRIIVTVLWWVNIGINKPKPKHVLMSICKIKKKIPLYHLKKKTSMSKGQSLFTQKSHVVLPDTNLCMKPFWRFCRRSNWKKLDFHTIWTHSKQNSTIHFLSFRQWLTKEKMKYNYL